MRRFPLLVTVACGAVACEVAAVQRTFVAPSGSDGNACSLASPCRSFDKAISVTDPNGEIVVLGSGGYGSVTIDKSITIAAPAGIYAGISVFAGTNGVDIATNGVQATLRGLTVNGQGGAHGVSITGVATTVDIDRCVISGMGQNGIHAAADGVNLSVKDSLVEHNGGAGISLAGAVRLRAERVRVERNGDVGIELTNEARGTIANSVIAGNASTGVQFLNTANVGTMVLVLSDSRVHDNGPTGVLIGTGAPGTLKFEGNGNVITGNAGHGVGASAANGGTVVATLRGNKIAHNGLVGVAAVFDATLNLADSVVVNNASYGLQQGTNAVFNSLGNNIVRDNNNGGAQRIGLFSVIGGL
jgi:hypothetical protein